MKSKKKAILVIFVMIILSTFMLSGCFKKDFKSMLTSHVWEFKEGIDGLSKTIEFKSDGRLTISEQRGDGSTLSGEGNWSIDGNALIYKYDFSIKNSSNVSYNGSTGTITLSYKELSDNDLSRGLINANENEWYVSGEFLVMDEKIYSAK